MTTRTVDISAQRRKRELRLRIGRLRRRLDGRATANRRQLVRLASWKTYVRRYPIYAVLAAAGMGLFASAGLGRGRWARLLGTRLLRRAGQQAGDRVWQEVERIWAASAPGSRSSQKGGGADE